LDRQTKPPRIPVPEGAIQVNFCKNPTCPNFGLPASQDKQPRGPGAESRGRDAYTIGTAKETDAIMLRCNLCGEYPTIKSNLAISEELSRMSDYLTPVQPITCPNTSCLNHSVDISTSGAYYSFGKTKSGSQRYQCRICRKTFAVGNATTGQKKPNKNILVFRLLMNKMPFKRICETAGINMWTLYWKIDFLHKQCLAFAAHREQALLNGMPLERLYLGVDRQDYMVNWFNATDKRNVILHVVGCADNETGFVFGLHLNYDPALDATTVEKEAEALGDYTVKIPFRRHARVWLKKDYEESVKASGRRRRIKTYGTLPEDIALSYEEAVKREDIEVSEDQTISTKLPAKGMQVHAEYSLYGHFFFLKSLFSGVKKVRFFLDQDSGMRAACLGAFAEEIRQQRCDAFYVRINAKLTINEKRSVIAGVRKEWANQKKLRPALSDSKLKLFLIKKRMKEVMHFGKWQDKWIYHPFPNMSEPEKAVCYLTDIQGYDEDHLAWLYNKASLHSIDRFFMQVRRRLSLLERPIATSSSTGRRWHGYNAYNPAVITKVLDIFRVFYNYIEDGNDEKTPAMRLGLSKSKVGMEDIIYYT
jgi:transposase-like protein